MRKSTSAGIIAGAVSSVPLGIIIPTLLLLSLWRHVPQGPTKPFNPVLFAIFLDAFFLLPTLAIIVCLGAIAGFVYAKIQKKLPFHSTYGRAGFLSLCVWVVLFVASVNITRLNPYILFHFFRYYLIVLVLFGFDAVVFAILFNRWTKTR